MKQTLSFLTAMCLALCLVAPTLALAADTENAAILPSNKVSTVGTPKLGLSDTNQEPAPIPKTDPPAIYPSSVYETQENGGRQIVKSLFKIFKKRKKCGIIILEER